MEVNRFQLSTVVTKIFILDICKGPGLVKMTFVRQKKPSKSIQKVLLKEIPLSCNYKIIFIIAGSSFLLLSKVELFATIV